MKESILASWLEYVAFGNIRKSTFDIYGSQERELHKQPQNDAKT
jgi:hypothetical protein